MAERRMFAKTIIDSDAFLDMPLSTQALYFHLSMRADDDGFVNNPRKIQRMIGASDDDCKLLMAKRFILTFENGVIVIKHWKIHNYIQKDRYKETVYLDEKSTLEVDVNGAYTERDQDVYTLDTPCIQPVSNLETQDRLGKDRLELGKVRGEFESDDEMPQAASHAPAFTEEKPKKATTRFIPPTYDEVRAFCEENGYGIDPEHFVDYYTANGWMVGGRSKMKDWKASVRTWVKKDKERGFNRRTETSQPNSDTDNIFLKLLREEQAKGQQGGSEL